MYKTIIGPTVTYGGESWTLTNEMKRTLMVWEICGTKCENGYGWIKMNQEIYNKLKSPDVVIVIEVCR
jgi:hypothetical protein